MDEKVINKNGMVFSVRDVLLSTGELTKEAVINNNGVDFYESAPFGMTLGLNETQSRNYSGIEKILELNNQQKIVNYSQLDFDNVLTESFDSQTSTAFSLAFLKSSAYIKKYDTSKIFKYISSTYGLDVSKPKIISNILNGSKHANNKLEFCEFMIIPKGNSTQENVQIISEVYIDLESIILEKLGHDNLYIGREGGFSPNIIDINEALNLVLGAINKRHRNCCSVAIDIAANNFCRLIGDKFIYTIKNKDYSTTQLMEYYVNLIKSFPEIVYLEDPFHEFDVAGWKDIFQKMSSKLLIVADDITISKIDNIQKYKECFNACILKINQAGSFSDLLNSLNFCKQNNIRTIISQRSGETDSNILAHLAVGLGADYIKSGAPARERIVKYNELIRIS